MGIRGGHVLAPVPLSPKRFGGRNVSANSATKSAEVQIPMVNVPPKQ
jgi:hypothetical protein